MGSNPTAASFVQGSEVNQSLTSCGQLFVRVVHAIVAVPAAEWRGGAWIPMIPWTIGHERHKARWSTNGCSAQPRAGSGSYPQERLGGGLGGSSPSAELEPAVGLGLADPTSPSHARPSLP